eukprot:TRINITY_DN1015_c0_g1_i1.p1 TRINITY_DN1015_c0_g1~~TRINITY_DN1015_c0_g1_i1.p1  ORF type:complete len:290 (+),score=78.62 TRINITY_DN1015_c0_g1_i1:144-1013(+)
MERKYDFFGDFIERYDVFLFDCDGVLWHGGERVAHAFETLQKLTDLGKRVLFLTNNSTLTREEYVKKIASYGYTPRIEQIYSTSWVTAQYLKRKHPDIKKVYVVGLESVAKELEEVGIASQPVAAHNGMEMNMTLFKDLTIDPELQAVVAAYDHNFNYYKLCYASLLIQEGRPFVATNEDSYIVIGGRKLPGGGTVVRAIAKATETEPLVIGKPNPYMCELVCETYSVEKSRCLFIGDRLDTDILFARNAGINSALVMTGVTSEEELKREDAKGEQAIRSTFIIKDLAC